MVGLCHRGDAGSEVRRKDDQQGSVSPIQEIARQALSAINLVTDLCR